MPDYDAHAGLDRIASYVEDLTNERDRLERERDEAVALLRALVNACTPMQTVNEMKSGRVFGVRLPEKDTVESARAFLARTKG